MFSSTSGRGFGSAFICIGLLMVSNGLVSAKDFVTPSGDVQNYVRVREGPSTSTDEIGKLAPGESFEYVASVPRWYKIEMPNLEMGFVSKRWTDLVPEAASFPDFEVHFIDVGTGDSAIIDMGDEEIIIDGGMYVNDLWNYVKDHDIIDGPVELVVVTHPDSDHWKGLNRFLGFDGENTDPPQVLEFWEPGYDRDCAPNDNYSTFIENVSAMPGITFRRPLEDTHSPADVSGSPQSFSIGSLPGIVFTVLNSDSTPNASNGSCAYLMNNTSIVLMIEIAGHRFLFTGDANGKERTASGSGAAEDIEEKLLVLEAGHPGTLRADVLKAPHHGSETASTDGFIAAVDPEFVIVSASTAHHLPKETTMDRYENGIRNILRTDIERPKGNDHIICFNGPGGELDCNYEDVLLEQ